MQLRPRLLDEMVRTERATLPTGEITVSSHIRPM
jgi:hypothetical protein